MRKLTEKDVTFEITCLPEDTQIRGNAVASGDDEIDRETENWILAQLDSGNDWAWCRVRVAARWNGWSGVDYLGGCSYLSEEDFRAGGYFEDMKQCALDDLNTQLSAACETLRPLCEEYA